jgi:hypothetical protein
MQLSLILSGYVVYLIKSFRKLHSSVLCVSCVITFQLYFYIINITSSSTFFCDFSFIILFLFSSIFFLKKKIISLRRKNSIVILTLLHLLQLMLLTWLLVLLVCSHWFSLPWFYCSFPLQAP